MRWKAIVILLPILLLLGVAGYFGTDLLLRWSIEHSLEMAVGARVEARPVHLDYFNLKLTIGELQITNPANTWRNLIQAKNIKVGLEATPLFSGKIVINEVNIDDLILNAPRKTDGKIKQVILPGPLGEAQQKLNRDIAAIPALSPETLQKGFDASKLFEAYQFQTNLSADSVQAKIDTTHQQWQENLKAVDEIKAEIAELRQKVANFQSAKPGNILEIRDKLAELKELKHRFDSVRDRIKQTTSGYQADFAQLRTDIAALKEAAEGDYRALLGLAKLPNFNSINYTESLLGAALLNESASFVRLADELQTMIPVRIENPPKQKHPRGGQDIVFPGRKTYPRFLIRHIGISGQGTPGSFAAGFRAKGSLEGITSEPQIYGRPMLAALSGTAGESFLNASGRLEHLSSGLDSRFEIKLGGLPLPAIELPDSPYLPQRLTSGTAEINSEVRIRPEYLLVDLTLSGNHLIGQYSQPTADDDLMRGIIRDALARIDTLSLRYRLETVGKELTMRISSNLDELIASRFKAVIGERIAEFTATIRARVDAELQAGQRKLEATRAEYEAKIGSKVDEVRLMLDQEEQKLAAKKQELEAKQKELERKILDPAKLKLPKLKF
jgi:uncharacterized protein (TIGR03545 family)